MTYCDPDGVAWIFMRWVFTLRIPSPAKKVNALDLNNWQVWGAYDSAPNNPPGNTDNLAQYGMDLGIVARSAWRVQQAFGFWTDETAQATISSVAANVTNLDLSKVVSWNMAVCDLHGILNGAHFTALGTSGTVSTQFHLSLARISLAEYFANDILLQGWTGYITCACTTMTDLNGKAFPEPFPANPSIPVNVCAGGWS